MTNFFSDAASIRIAIRGFLGALVGGILGVMLGFLGLPLLLMSGAGWGYAMGGWPLARRGANASAAAFLVAGILAILAMFAGLSNSWLQTIGGMLTYPGYIGTASMAGAFGGVIFAYTLRLRSLATAGAITGGTTAAITASLILVVYTLCHVPSSSDGFDFLAPMGILLIGTPLIAFTLSAPILSMLYSRSVDEDNHRR